MNLPETIDIADLRPLPGIPAATVRAQVEVTRHLQQGLIAAVVNDDTDAVVGLSCALSNCVSTLTEMTIAPDVIDADRVASMISTALDEREHVASS